MIEPIEPLTAALAGRYAIERKLGAGGMATVYLARDLKHSRHVAIKLLHPDLAATLGADRFHREIRVTATLQHPNVLTLIDSGDAGGLLYYVMPFVDGESLRSRIEREKQLDIHEALRIAREVAAALHYAHERGVIHRDIKPENILLASRAPGAPALVADFGIAHTADDVERLTSTGITVGTAAYMSPEQATGERSIDRRSDIYSLACVVYEMLAGEPPFTGANPRVVLAKQLTDQVRPIRRLRETVPESIDAAIARGLARGPSDRPSTAIAFAESLERAERDVGRRRVSRAPLRFATAGALTVAAVAAAWTIFAKSSDAMPAIRVERFTVPQGDTASSYLAATLEQDVVQSLAASRAVRVYQTSASQVSSDFVVSAKAQRTRDSVQLVLNVTRGRSGEVMPIATVTLPLGRVQEMPATATSALLATLGVKSRVRFGAAATRDSIAYDLYLRGRYLADRRTEAASSRSIAAFREAITRDPTFAEAWAGLTRALVYANNRRFRIPTVPTDSLAPYAVEASDRALELDSTRAYVWIARGLALRIIEPTTSVNAVRAMDRAVAVDSTLADAWFYSGNYWEDSLVSDRALAGYRRALAIDPTHRQALGFMALHYMWRRQYDSAAKWADSGKRVDPTHILIREASGTLNLLRQSPSEAEDDFRAVLRVGQGTDLAHGFVGLAGAMRARGDRRAADTLLIRAIAYTDTLHPSAHEAAYLAAGYAEAGQHERAIRLLERYEPRRDKHFQLHLQRDPQLDPLRSDPRFALLTRGAVP